MKWYHVLLVLLAIILIPVILIVILIIFKQDDQVETDNGEFNKACRTTGNACNAGLTCDAGICKKSPGSVCSTSAECTEGNGYFCSGKCVNGPKGGLNEYCSCNTGLLCTPTSDGTNRCKISPGQPCTADRDCSSNICDNGRCTVSRGPGGACTTNSDCETNNCSINVCQPQGITTGQPGAYCNAIIKCNDQCNLTTNICVVPTRRGFGELCDTTNICDTGMTCVSGHCVFDSLYCVSGVRVNGECKNNNSIGCCVNGDCVSNNCSGLSSLSVISFSPNNTLEGARSAAIRRIENGPLLAPDVTKRFTKILAVSTGTIDSILLINRQDGIYRIDYNVSTDRIVNNWTKIFSSTKFIDASVNDANLVALMQEQGFAYIKVITTGRDIPILYNNISLGITFNTYVDINNSDEIMLTLISGANNSTLLSGRISGDSYVVSPAIMRRSPGGPTNIPSDGQQLLNIPNNIISKFYFDPPQGTGCPGSCQAISNYMYSYNDLLVASGNLGGLFINTSPKTIDYDIRSTTSGINRGAIMIATANEIIIYKNLFRYVLPNRNCTATRVAVSSTRYYVMNSSSCV